MIREGESKVAIFEMSGLVKATLSVVVGDGKEHGYHFGVFKCECEELFRSVSFRGHGETTQIECKNNYW